MHKMLGYHPFTTLDLGVWNIQKLTRYQTLLYPRDMDAGRPVPPPDGVELLDLLRILYQNVVVIGYLGGGVLHVAHCFSVISTHREDDAGKFARGFVLPVVLGVELQHIIG